jgi:hypothetical protein
MLLCPTINYLLGPCKKNLSLGHLSPRTKGHLSFCIVALILLIFKMSSLAGQGRVGGRQSKKKKKKQRKEKKICLDIRVIYALSSWLDPCR